ncbi:MAG: site-2 protease family protein [Desulfobacteraceae bacterium]|nr:site-2 protease family protein [Desulfobacteraceae bacterium]
MYFGTISYLLTPQGSVAFFLCLALLKIGHEFAHAYSAKSMGLHVRSMGIFFIVLWPLLYTDVTDVWKIPDRRKRIRVAAAGVLFEIVVGGLAFLGWVVLSDGILKSLMFFYPAHRLSLRSWSTSIRSCGMTAIISSWTGGALIISDPARLPC